MVPAHAFKPALAAAAAVVALLAAASHAAKLTAVADFGDNPSKITMSIYVPDKLPAKPAVIVVVGDAYPPALNPCLC